MNRRDFLKALGGAGAIIGLPVAMGLRIPESAIAAPRSMGPLVVSSTNPRYFANATPAGPVVYLTGTYSSRTFQDRGTTAPPPVFDFDEYLVFLQQHKHNFVRGFVWESVGYFHGDSITTHIDPMIYARPGPGTARDGGPKFDLTQFNQAYFDRLRSRVMALADIGVYVSLQLFQGWSIQLSDPAFGDPWPAHPFNISNNINGIDGDPDGDGKGEEIHTLQVPAITALQEAYVRKVIDTVNDLDNVLYEISNEDMGSALAWQSHMIGVIRGYEAGQPKQHPIGMTALYPGSTNADLFASGADWISPNDDSVYFANPAPSGGEKVVIVDSDHLLTDETPHWIWSLFTRGHNAAVIDNGFEKGQVSRAMGFALVTANSIDLARMVPRGDLASTTYCLAKPDAGGEYLVYVPNGGSVTVDLTATPGALAIAWIDTTSGTAEGAGAIPGGTTQQLTAPSGAALLHLTAAPPAAHRRSS